MDITMPIVTFLAGGSVLAAVVTQFAKKILTSVSDRWGSLATQILLFVVSLVVASGMYFFQFIPTNILVAASAMTGGAVFLYEFAYKAIWQQAISNKVA